MQLTRTIRCKLSVFSEDVPVLNELFSRYAKAVSRIAQWGRDNRESNAIRLHHSLYRDIRKEFGLSANLAVTALRKAAGTLKAAKMRGKFIFRPTFVGLDARTFTLKGETVSFSTHTGKRIKAALDIGNYQRENLTPDPTSATLVKARDGFYCNIVVASEVPDAAPGGVLGVDLGIRNIAVTSTGRKFDGKAIREYREDRLRIRASLMSKGTKGSKRTLIRLSGRERRHAAWVNHNIAKAIVSEAIREGCSTIAFENLKGIRNRLRIPCKQLNRMVSLWSFFQIRELVRYKAAAKGIKTIEVNPAYTSQTCHVCRKRGFRDGETFSCTTCGEFDADVNAARNIAGGGVVNRLESNGQVVAQATAS